MSLTKADIIDSISLHCGFSRIHSINLTETVLETIKRTFASGEYVLISGLGKFCVNHKN